MGTQEWRRYHQQTVAVAIFQLKRLTMETSSSLGQARRTKKVDDAGHHFLNSRMLWEGLVPHTTMERSLFLEEIGGGQEWCSQSARPTDSAVDRAVDARSLLHQKPFGIFFDKAMRVE